MSTKLGEWLTANSMTNKEFAALCAPFMGQATLSERTVESWRAGGMVPRKKALEAIVAVTQGEVTANSFIDLPDVA